MKQDAYFYPLSLQHEGELEQCLQLRQGVQKKADVAVLKDFTFSFWKNNLLQHIQVEEDKLLPELEKLNFSAHYLHMIRRDHDLLRTLIERIGVDGEEHTVYETFASLVEYHIKFEETVLFPCVEASLTDQQLESISRLLPSRQSGASEYPVRFWE